MEGLLLIRNTSFEEIDFWTIPMPQMNVSYKQLSREITIKRGVSVDHLVVTSKFE